MLIKTCYKYQSDQILSKKTSYYLYFFVYCDIITTQIYHFY